jgi:hypothetical protein
VTKRCSLRLVLRSPACRRRSCASLRGFATEAAEPLRSRRFVDWLRVVARAGNGGSGCVRYVQRRAQRLEEH